eukprot:4944844-Prymnesium_polylepis.1
MNANTVPLRTTKPSTGWSNERFAKARHVDSTTSGDRCTPSQEIESPTKPFWGAPWRERLPPILERLALLTLNERACIRASIWLVRATGKSPSRVLSGSRGFGLTAAK